jgi:hypothetical protein
MPTLTQHPTVPMIALRDSDRKHPPSPGPEVFPFQKANFKLVPPVLACSEVSEHRYSYSEKPGCNIVAARHAHYLNATSHTAIQGEMCCDHVVAWNGMSSLCMCQPTNKVSPRSQTDPATAVAKATTLVVDALFVLPPYLRHAPHWLEELAQLCNALTLDVVGFDFDKRQSASAGEQEVAPLGFRQYSGKFPAVLVELPLNNLGPILDQGAAAVARAASEWPSKAALRDIEVWADEYCSIVTAALLQATAHTIIHAQPTAAAAPQLIAYLNVSSMDSREDRQGKPVSRVVTSKQIHHHESIRAVANGLLPFSGRHFFASRRACDIYRNSMRSMWHGTRLRRRASSVTGQTLRVMITNRPSDSRTIANAGELATALQKLDIKGYEHIVVEHSVRQNQTFAEMFQGFAEADVVVAAHGGILAMLPAMRPGSLIIEVFADPALGGTCLTFFIGLGTQCGVAHRVYHGSGKHKHILDRQGLRGCWLGNGREPKKVSLMGHRIDPAVILSMIEEWARNPADAISDRTDNPSRLAALRSATPCAGCNRPVWWETQ